MDRMPPDGTNRRKYPRFRPPKGMWVGWKAPGQTATSKMDSMGMGGLFLHAEKPPSPGSTIELLFDLPTGEVRARAVVRRSIPGKGMGVQFIQMRPEDRAKLNQYLLRQEAAEKEPPAPATSSSAKAQPSKTKAAKAAGAPASAKPVPVPQAPSPKLVGWQLAILPRTEAAAQLRFERDVQNLVAVTGKGTYYQLLGVTSESSLSQVKKSYYALVRRFHPDNHPNDKELARSLKDLMVVVTEAYKTLSDGDKRAAYDKRLARMGTFAMNRRKTGAEETVEEWFKRANECLRAKNFVGSIVWLRKCVDAAPQQASYRAMLARSLGKVPQYRNEAVEQFQKSLELDPWREPVYFQFAELCEEMLLPARAREIYSRLLEINPANDRALERLAELDRKAKAEKRSVLVSTFFGKKG